MSEAFDWNRALRSDSEPAAAPQPAAAEPAPAEEPEVQAVETAVSEPPHFEVVEGGAESGLMVLPDPEPEPDPEVEANDTTSASEIAW